LEGKDTSPNSRGGGRFGAATLRRKKPSEKGGGGENKKRKETRFRHTEKKGGEGRTIYEIRSHVESETLRAGGGTKSEFCIPKREGSVDGKNLGARKNGNAWAF